MRAYGQQRAYCIFTRVLRAYAGKARKIYVGVKNRKAGRRWRMKDYE